MGHRTDQVNELIKTELGKIFIRDVEFPLGSIVTITKVETNPDMKSARVFLVIHPVEQNRAVFKLLKKMRGLLQHHLIKTLEMAHIPHLTYSIDTNPDQKDETDEIFRHLDMERKENKIDNSF